MNVYEMVTNQVIEALETGGFAFTDRWDRPAPAFVMPLRSTGETYQGINILLLWIAAHNNQFTSAHWFTYKQAKTLNAQVKKGAKSTKIIYYGTYTKKDENGDEKEASSRFAKVYSVFNADQIEGLPEEFYIKPKEPRIFENDHVDELDAFFKGTGATYSFEGDRAYYDRAGDFIKLPPIRRFVSVNAFYSTLAHEIAHWTGAEHRLNREKGKKFADKAYCIEECVAELSALFTMSHLNARYDFPNSVAYISQYLDAMKADPKFIFTAASAASEATDYLIDQAKTKFCANAA